jgi:hypothetical protein
MPATASAPAARSVRVLSRDGDAWLLVEVTDRGASEQYLVRPCPSDVGPAWRWEHAQKQVAYTCQLEGEQGPAGCTCPHGTHRGQARKECRHVAASRALIGRGKLRCQ